MPTLAWEPGCTRAPYHLHSFIRLGHIMTPDATPCHDHHQPRHLPHAIVAAGDFGRYTIVDLLQGTAVQVPSFEAKQGPLPETELWL